MNAKICDICGKAVNIEDAAFLRITPAKGVGEDKDVCPDCLKATREFLIFRRNVVRATEGGSE